MAVLKTFIAINTDGDTFDFRGFDASNIRLQDVARSLSYTNRFNGCFGQVPVAAHCMAVSELARAAGADMDTQRWALLHDAHEAYIGDIAAPLRNYLGPHITELSDRVDEAVAESLDVSMVDVSAFDLKVLALEASWFGGLSACFFKHIDVSEAERDVFRDQVRFYRMQPADLQYAYTRMADALGIAPL